PADVWTTVARERVASVQIVGDAFARPLIDELHRHSYDLSALRFIVSGGAVLSAVNKQALLDLVPGVQVIDIVGSSEAGRQGVHTSSTRSGAATGSFGPSAGATVLDDARTAELAPGTGAIGWLASAGRVPLGYLGDPDKTRATFPVIGGSRYSVPGDRARRAADGSIELLGREAVCINTGGEKVFAEEVEQVLKAHPAVVDALVVGRPSELWGQEVVAVVHLRAPASDDELRAACAEHLARYKLPKAIIRRDAIGRTPSGKPDYTWAKTQVSGQ
ncbi:MAG TPA: acyl-CoA synthetase, partial [Acidimicrobiales bacterium]